MRAAFVTATSDANSTKWSKICEGCPLARGEPSVMWPSHKQFELALRDDRAAVPVFDALDRLVEATVRFTCGEAQCPAFAASAAFKLDREIVTT